MVTFVVYSTLCLPLTCIWYSYKNPPFFCVSIEQTCFSKHEYKDGIVAIEGRIEFNVPKNVWMLQVDWVDVLCNANVFLNIEINTSEFYRTSIEKHSFATLARVLFWLQVNYWKLLEGRCRDESLNKLVTKMFSKDLYIAKALGQKNSHLFTIFWPQILNNLIIKTFM